MRKHNSIRNNWLITYITIALMPILISIGMFFVLDGFLKEEINRSNEFFLTQVMQYGDELAYDVEKLSTQLAFNVNVQRIINDKSGLNDEKWYMLYECYKSLMSYSVNINAVDEYFIYFNDIDVIINNTTAKSSSEFFLTSDLGQELSRDQWLSILKNKYRGTYVSLPNSKSSSEGKLIFIQSLPFNSVSGTEASIVISMDKNKLLKMADEIETLNRGKLAILNENNEVIAGTSGVKLPNNIGYDNLKNQSGVLIAKVDGERMATSYIHSKAQNWKYVYIMPTEVFWSKLLKTRRLIYFEIILSCILALAVIRILLRKNYIPIKQLLNSVSRHTSVNINDGGNEYNLIENVVSNVINEKEEMNKWMAQQRESLVERFIERLLKGNLVQNTLLSSMKHLEVRFDSDYFSVMLFHVDDMKEMFKSWPDNNDLEKLKIFEFVISNIVRELSEERYLLYFVTVDSDIVCLVNYRNAPAEDAIPVIKDICYQAQDFIKKYYKIDVTIAVSSLHNSIEEISTAFDEVAEILEFKEILGVQGVTSYDEIKHGSSHQYYYPMENEQKLINGVKAGDFEKAEEIVEEIFYKNFKEKALTGNIAKFLIHNIVGTLLKAIDSIMEVTGEDYMKEFTQVEQLISIKNTNKIKQEILNILNSICSRINLEEDKDSDFKQKVISFIYENYRDENLSLAAIGDKFKMHPSYVSRLFKKQSGDGIVEFISKVRVDKAKEILKKEKLNMEEVSKSVGYSNVRTFTRAFSKLEGITPGKYRELNT